MEQETFDISASQLIRAEERLSQLQRRARKLGLSDAIGVEVVRRYKRERRSDITGEVIDWQPRCEVTISGEAPCLPGYTFVATVEHLAEGNVVRQVPGVVEEGALEAWRAGQPICEHCRTNRARKDTYLISEDRTGRIFQVGSSCVVDFAGEGADLVGKLALLLGLLRDFCRSLGGEDEDYQGGRVERLLDLTYYLSYVAASIRQTGWTSKAKARETETLATAEHAFNCLFDDERCKNGTGCTVRSHNHIERTEKDHEEARRAVGYVEGLAEVENKNDYLHNLYVACASQAISRRHLGIAASAVVARRNAEERQVEREQKAKARNELFVDAYLPGKVGERIKGVEVTLLGTKELESQWGVSFLHNFVASGGFRVTWFASSEQNFEVGGTYTVDLSIKKFDDRYGKTAVVTRVSVSKVKKARAA